jgi:hypothetical protein
MSPAPSMSPQGARLRERTQPMAMTDEAYGWAHAILCGTLGTALAQVGEIADPEDPLPPLAPLLDAELCPTWALPWLAQFVGVRIPPGTPPDAARVLITSVAGFSRGTPAALRAAAGLYLTGEKTVYFRERDADDAYALEVVTLDSETPDPDAVRAALLAQKPGGIVLRYHPVIGWDYEQMTAEGGIYSALAGRFADYFDLANNHRIP